MLKIMQIGYGYWGNNVAKKLMQSKKFELLYLIDSDEKKLRMAKDNFPGVIADSDYIKYLDEVDAVAICTQTEYSYEIAMNAMERGKHVFTEKPLAQNMDLAKKMVDKARERNVVLHCDHLMVYNPIIRYIKGMIDRGELGDIIYIDISRVNLGIVRKDINAMLDLAVHDIAVVDYLLDGFVPEELNVIGTKYCGKQETITYLTMKADEKLVSIKSSWVSPIKVRDMVIGGTKKMVVFNDLDTDNKLTIYDSGIDVVQGEVYGEYEFKNRIGDVYKPHIDFEDSLLNSVDYFAKIINENAVELSGPNQCLRVMEILENAKKQF